MNSPIRRISFLVLSALTGTFVTAATTDPAQEIADRRNRVIVEAESHLWEDFASVVAALTAINRSEPQGMFSQSDADRLRPRLNRGWELGTIFYLRTNGERAGLCFVSFDDDSDDVVARISVKDGKISALWVR